MVLAQESKEEILPGEELVLNIEDLNCANILYTLGHKTRLKIFRVLVKNNKANISQIATILFPESKHPEANISYQAKWLEKAGLVNIKFQAGKNGIAKILSPKYKRIIINLF